MNDYTTMLLAAGRMDDRLREAEQVRRARLVASGAPARDSAISRLVQRVRAVGLGFGPAPAAARPERTPPPTSTSATEVCAC
ncbi:MAG TPA: hypothetical protein VFO73_09195 [Candidatus Limnocylindrales bacterium]|nr:hypothetical protein [Candidatus Limnocylindrales bacterium]